MVLQMLESDCNSWREICVQLLQSKSTRRRAVDKGSQSKMIRYLHAINLSSPSRMSSISISLGIFQARVTLARRSSSCQLRQHEALPHVKACLPACLRARGAFDVRASSQVRGGLLSLLSLLRCPLWLLGFVLVKSASTPTLLALCNFLLSPSNLSV